MASENVALVAFNRGRISPLALARTDFNRTALSAEVQTNWLPRILGAMMLRPGLEYTGATRSNAPALTLPFVKSITDTARLELTDGFMRVWIGDALVTRPTVATTVTNGSFASDLAGWTDLDASSALSTWVSGGYLSLAGVGNAPARRQQQVTVAIGDRGQRHALTIVVARGPVLLRVGTGGEDDSYVAETVLGTGVHSLAFTPTDNFWIDLRNYQLAAALVESVTVAPAGTMELAAPWAAADFPSLRWDQSGDVVFVAAPGHRQRRIERRAADSWSIVTYQSDNGPFRAQNTGPIVITPSDINGDVLLNASEALFRPGQVGALFRLTQTGQSAVADLAGADQFSEPIRVTGIDGERAFAVILTGTWAATVTLQYSVGAPGAWIDAALGTFTTNTAISYDDTLDNQVIFYRIGVKGGNYASGTVEATLSYSSGSQTGVARITGYTSPTQVQVAVLAPFGNSTGTSEWAESCWSDLRGYPSSVAFYEGRLWWAGKDRIWGSVSDSFADFDDTTEGDSGPISRSIGAGPVDTIHWLLPLQRLLLGADGAVRPARSSSLDEPLSPTNFNLKEISTIGAAPIAAVKLDTGGVFVGRGGTRVYEAAYDGGTYDYAVTELTGVVPEVGAAGIVKIVVQHHPEKRFHCIRADGTVALLVYDRQEQVSCWIDIVTAGSIEDAVVLPSPDGEDLVWYTVARTIGGTTVRYHERFAPENECCGYPVARLADACIRWTGTAATTITGLDALEGAEVVCWGWNTVTPFTDADGVAIGRDLGTYIVSGGAIAGLPVAVTDAVVGLAYSARYTSTKLTYAAESGTALCCKKRVSNLGIVARWLHARGLRYGPGFDRLDDLPLVEGAGAVDPDTMHRAYDEEMFAFPGEWDTDARLCLEAASPRPATVLAAVIGIETSG